MENGYLTLSQFRTRVGFERCSNGLFGLIIVQIVDQQEPLASHFPQTITPCFSV